MKMIQIGIGFLIDSLRVDQPSVNFDELVRAPLLPPARSVSIQQLQEVVPDIFSRLVLPGADECDLHQAPVGGAGRLSERFVRD